MSSPLAALRPTRQAESRRLVALLRLPSRPLVAAAVVSAALAGLFPVGFLVATSLLLGLLPEAVGSGWSGPAGAQLQRYLALAAGAFAGQVLSDVALEATTSTIARRIDRAIRDRLMAASMLAADLSAVEDDENRALLAEAGMELQDVWATPGKAAVGLLHLLARYVQLVAAAVALAIAFTWWIALLLLCAGMYHRVRAVRRVRTTVAPDEQASAWWREAAYFARSLGTEPAAAKEIRIFDLTEWTRRHHEAPAWAREEHQAEQRRTIAFPTPLRESILVLIVAAGVLILAAHAADDGRIGLGSFVFVVTAGFSVVRSIVGGEHDFLIAWGQKGLDNLERFERRTASAADRPGADRRRRRAGAISPSRTVAFEGVTFTYPGRPRPVLENLDLEIEVGRPLAIVGANGAGKTTLIKLLSGLYEPTGGRISVDGVDLRELDRAQWRGLVAPIFQDFVRYELGAADNIGFGAVEHLHDRDAVRVAADRAGVLELLDGLPHGLDTPLSTRFADGIDLSGGQWQRVAAARALAAVQAGASVLVLDEPTANLDVHAELAFFTRFLDVTAGCTTIVVSHRFSTVRRVQRIVVLEAGAVIEDGHHDALMAANGRYAEMFTLQAQRFADGRDGAGDEDVAG